MPSGTTNASQDQTFTAPALLAPLTAAFARLAGWLAFALPLVLYATTLPPGVLYWDPAEMQTVPYILGIAHPTGFPLFVLAGWIYVHLFAVGNVAWRMSLFGALAMAAAARAAYALARAFELAPGAALGGALVFAAGFVAWSRGTRPEVHALALALLGAALASGVAFRRTGASAQAALSALAFGAALASHVAALLALPGLALIVLRRGTQLTRRAVTACAALFALPLCCYAYLPLRSAAVTKLRLDPTLALGISPGRPFWDYDHPAAAAGFFRLVTAADFHPGGFLSALAAPQAWHTAQTLIAPAFALEFGIVGLLLAMLGLVALVRRDQGAVAGVVLATALPALLSIAFTAEADRLRYLLPAFWVLAVFCAAGAQLVLQRWSPAALVALGLVLAFNNRHIADQRGDMGWPAYVDRVRAATPPDAIVVAEWALATPLAYAAYVERSMQDRIVEIALPQDDASAMRRWIRARPVYVVGSSSLRLPGLHLTIVDAGVPAVMRVEGAGSTSRRP